MNISMDARCLLAVVAFIVALTITGTDEYASEKLAERDLCAVDPKPDFCRGVE
jgi:hypothetical protein